MAFITLTLQFESKSKDLEFSTIGTRLVKTGF